MDLGAKGFLLGGAVVAAAMLPATGRAQDTARSPRDAQPERPTVATHAGTVARGFLEIESGVERDRGPGDARNAIGVFVAKVGLARRVQLLLFTTASAPGSASLGAGDMAVGVKWRLLESNRVLGDFAVLPSLKIPTGSAENGTGTGTTDASLLVISSRDVGPVHIDLNAGWTYRNGSESVPRDAWVWTASFGGALRGPVGWTVEWYGYPGTGGDAGSDPIVALLAGPMWTARNWLVFDVGLVVPVAGGQPRAIFGGVTYNVGQLFGKRPKP